MNEYSWSPRLAANYHIQEKKKRKKQKTLTEKQTPSPHLTVLLYQPERQKAISAQSTSIITVLDGNGWEGGELDRVMLHIPCAAFWVRHFLRISLSCVAHINTPRKYIKHCIGMGGCMQRLWVCIQCEASHKRSKFIIDRQGCWQRWLTC